MREPAGFLSRHLESVNDVIKILISTETDKKSRLLEVLKPKKEGKLIYGKGINCVTNVNAEKFSDILLTAYHYSPGDKDIPYPQYTAVTALNASFICVAEKVEDLEKLNFLMKLDFTTSKDLKPFTVAIYTHHYSQMPDIIKNANRQPELAYLMAWGQDYFNNPAPY